MDADLLVNLSTWRSLEALRAYTYQSAHRELLRGRAAWFASRSGPHLVLWWTSDPAPTVPQAMARLAHLESHGPTAHAFTFAHPFPAPA